MGITQTTVIILRGLPGAGKTTYAKRLLEGKKGVIVSSDSYPGLYDEDMVCTLQWPDDASKWCDGCKQDGDEQ